MTDRITRSIILLLLFVTIGCQQTFETTELTIISDESSEDLPGGIPQEEKKDMGEKYTGTALPIFENYFSKNDYVFGFDTDPRAMTALGMIPGFRYLDGKIYHSETEVKNKGTTEKPEWEQIKHFYSQSRETLSEIQESEFPGIPEKTRVTINKKPYKIAIETYQDQPISAAYFDDKREPFIMVSGAMVVPSGLLMNIDEGRGTPRPAGLWLWANKDKPPMRLGEAGILWSK